MSKEKAPKPGPDPERLKLPHKDWKDALREALRRKRPSDWSEDDEADDSDSDQEDE